jgi:hypothetical protein
LAEEQRDCEADAPKQSDRGHRLPGDVAKLLSIWRKVVHRLTDCRHGGMTPIDSLRQATPRCSRSSPRVRAVLMPPEYNQVEEENKQHSGHSTPENQVNHGSPPLDVEPHHP